MGIVEGVAKTTFAYSVLSYVPKHMPPQLLARPTVIDVDRDVRGHQIRAQQRGIPS